jgi:hypothetical protein
MNKGRASTKRACAHLTNYTHNDITNTTALCQTTTHY